MLDLLTAAAGTTAATDDNEEEAELGEKVDCEVVATPLDDVEGIEPSGDNDGSALSDEETASYDYCKHASV